MLMHKCKGLLEYDPKIGIFKSYYPKSFMICQSTATIVVFIAAVISLMANDEVPTEASRHHLSFIVSMMH